MNMKKLLVRLLISFTFLFLVGIQYLRLSVFQVSYLGEEVNQVILIEYMVMFLGAIVFLYGLLYIPLLFIVKVQIRIPLVLSFSYYKQAVKSINNTHMIMFISNIHRENMVVRC